MGRFGIRNYTGSWAEPVPGVRPLVGSDPWRVALVLAAIVGTVCLPRVVPWWGLTAIFVVPLVVCLLARVPVRHVLARVLAILPFGLLAVVFLPWSVAGPKVEWWGVTFGLAGLQQAGTISVKLLAVALWLSYLTAATPVAGLFAALRKLRVPGLLVDILESTVRYLSVLAQEARQMLLSCKVRAGKPEGKKGSGLSPRRLGRVLSRLSGLVAGLFLRTLKRSERCQSARESRHFGPEDDGGGGEGDYDPKNEVLVQGLSFSYPGMETRALTGVSLNIPRNTRIAILGANGAGKTTLLLHFNGVHLPQSGRVTVGGLAVEGANLSRVRRRVGMVFQNPDDQVFAATVYEDVRFGPDQAGHEEAEAARLAEEALRATGLWGHRDRAPFSLSQGERKRAAIAGVLAAGADILVFDEPMASLDPAGKDEIQVLLNDLHAAGKTLVVATHDVDFAAGWADGVVLMDRGQVVAVGAPSLLVDEAAMSVTGLALPLVSRPFERLRPLVKNRSLGLDRLPANVAEAFAWLKHHFVARQEKPGSVAPVMGQRSEAGREGAEDTDLNSERDEELQNVP